LDSEGSNVVINVVGPLICETEQNLAAKFHVFPAYSRETDEDQRSKIKEDQVLGRTLLSIQTCIQYFLLKLSNATSPIPNPMNVIPPFNQCKQSNQRR